MLTRIAAVARKVRDLAGRSAGAFLVLAAIAIIGLIGFVGVKLVGGGDDDESGRETSVASVDHSWVPGQASLASYPEFGPISGAASDLGLARLAEREDLLAEIERQLRLAEKREARRAQRELRAQRRAARREYQRALRAAARERRRQERAIARKKERIKERIEELREKYEVPPGRECEIPAVAKLFDCKTGKPDF